MAGLEETIAVEPSNTSTYFLEANGTVWAIGDGGKGQLGTGETEPSPFTPVRVALPEGVSAVALGEAKNEGFAIDSTGHVWAWGLNEEHSACLSAGKHLTGEEIPGLSEVQEVSGGTVHVLFRLRNGTVEACGSNRDSMSGQPEGVHEVTTPTPIAGLEDIVEISGGYGNDAITATGELLTWGLDEHGQACSGSETKAVYPPQVVELGVEQFYSAGDNYANPLSLMLVGGEVYGCGVDANGGVGDGGGANKDSPTPTGLHFAQIAAGAEYGFGLREGRVWAWGNGLHRQLGTGDTKVHLTPVLVDSGVSSIRATAMNSADLQAASKPPSRPTVVTAGASSLTKTAATLGATVNPNGATVSDCHFDYGTTTSYGSVTPCSSLPGSGESPVAVTASVAGLSADTGYHMRIAATNPGGMSYGGDVAFRTLPDPPVVTGGTAVTVTGTGLTGATRVSFGSAAATSFTVDSATSITATAPAGAGTVDITVTNPGGISAASPPTASRTSRRGRRRR